MHSEVAAEEAEASWWKASGHVVAIVNREPMTGSFLSWRITLYSGSEKEPSHGVTRG